MYGAECFVAFPRLTFVYTKYPFAFPTSPFAIPIHVFPRSVCPKEGDSCIGARIQQVARVCLFVFVFSNRTKP